MRSCICRYFAYVLYFAVSCLPYNFIWQWSGNWHIKWYLIFPLILSSFHRQHLSYLFLTWNLSWILRNTNAVDNCGGNKLLFIWLIDSKHSQYIQKQFGEASWYQTLCARAPSQWNQHITKVNPSFFSSSLPPRFLHSFFLLSFVSSSLLLSYFQLSILTKFSCISPNHILLLNVVPFV